MRLLIIEDDEKTARALHVGQERGGFSVTIAHPSKRQATSQ
jgi:DNA-binding response OmpR family regulator